MKLVVVISTAVLSLTLGAAAPVYARQDQHDQQEEQKVRPSQDEKKAQPDKPVKPEEKGAQVFEGRRDGRRAQRFSVGVQFLGQTGAKGSHLLDVELAKGFELGGGFESLDGAQRSVNRRVLLSIRGRHIEGVVALHALVFRAVF